jgi:hypothetical protein
LWATLFWFVGGGIFCTSHRSGAMDASGPGDAGSDLPLRTDSSGAAPDLAPDVQTDTALPASVFKLSDTAGVRLQVASDRTGAPVVMWTGPSGRTDSAYWNAAAARWVPLDAFDGGGMGLVDPNGGGQPLVRQDAPPPGQQSLDKTVRRFDPASGGWSALVALPGPPSLQYEWQLAIDGARNAHSFWRSSPSSSYGSWWRADTAAWEAAVPFDELYRLVASPAATFMWFDRNTLGVRRFDAVAGTWSEPVELADFPQATLRMRMLVVGRNGAPLMASLEREPDQLVVEAWRAEGGTNLWAARELVETIPVSGDPTSLEGPIGALADPVQDFLWVPVKLADGSFEAHVHRYDPGQRAWALSRVLRSSVGSPRLELRADGAGRVYGHSPGASMRFDPGAGGWQDTPTGIGSGGILRASDAGAFIAGYANGDELVVLRSDAGGEWRPARGYPGGAHPSVGSVPYAMEIAGPERAVVVWTVAFGADAGVWAALVE